MLRACTEQLSGVFTSSTCLFPMHKYEVCFKTTYIVQVPKDSSPKCLNDYNPSGTGCHTDEVLWVTGPVCPPYLTCTNLPTVATWVHRVLYPQGCSVHFLTSITRTLIANLWVGVSTHSSVFGSWTISSTSQTHACPFIAPPATLVLANQLSRLAWESWERCPQPIKNKIA